MEQEIIEKYESLIYKIAKKFYNVELCDLYQAGCIGLINAYRNYDTTTNNNFINFAYMYIFGEMYNLVNNSQDIKLTKEYNKLSKLINKAITNLYEQNGKTPTTAELSEYLQLDEETIIEILKLTQNVISLDAPINQEDTSYIDTIGISTNIDDQILINDSLKELTNMEQEVIINRYFNDLTQKETANLMGISQVKVSRIEQKSKIKIKEYIKS